MRRYGWLLVLIVSLLMGSISGSHAQRKRVGALVGPLRLVPNSGVLAVSGLHDYFGTIELKTAADGIVVVNRLPLEDYLLGLNEVPTRWPEQALEAQAIAARTYALWTLARPAAGSAAVYGFDICASVQCQVFSGADVVREASMGARWRAAVRATEDRAVLYRGEPILARYHSTSGGQTFDNEQIFPSEGSFPYLQGVRSVTEEASPLYRWYVDFTLPRLQRIVRRAGLLPMDAGRLVEVRTVESAAGAHYPDVLLIGKKGRARISAETLRVNVRSLAPDMFPGRYPSFAPTSSGRLPEVFPSNRLDITTEEGTVEVVGRGWGHGVGMSQWGAEGMARAGASAAEILRHYYTGVEIGEVPSSGPIEVGVAWGSGEVVVTGDLKLVDGNDRTVVKNALGSWRFTPAGGAIEVKPPRGFGLPLEVGIVEAPDEVVAGERTEITVALSRPARLKAYSGERSGRGRIFAAGERKVAWVAPDEPGDHQVEVAADDGGRTRKDAVTISVLAEARETASVGPRSENEDKPVALGLAALLGLIAAVFALRKVTMKE